MMDTMPLRTTISKPIEEKKFTSFSFKEQSDYYPSVESSKQSKFQYGSNEPQKKQYDSAEQQQVAELLDVPQDEKEYSSEISSEVLDGDDSDDLEQDDHDEFMR